MFIVQTERVGLIYEKITPVLSRKQKRDCNSPSGNRAPPPLICDTNNSDRFNNRRVFRYIKFCPRQNRIADDPRILDRGWTACLSPAPRFDPCDVLFSDEPELLNGPLRTSRSSTCLSRVPTSRNFVKQARAVPVSRNAICRGISVS